MTKPRRTKYQWVDSKWVQLFQELREVREKFVIYIYFRNVSMSATMVEAILNPNTEERPVETGRKQSIYITDVKINIKQAYNIISVVTMFQ